MMLRGLRTVRQKLVGVVLLTTFVALFVALFTVMAYNLRVYHQNLIADMNTQSALIAHMTEPALAFDDKQLALQNLGLLGFQPRIRAAAIYDARGQLFATYGSAAGLPLRPEADSVRRQGLNLVLFKRIVSGDQEFMGTMYLRADYEFAARVIDYGGIAAMVMLLAMLIAYLLSARLQRIVTNPILAIAEVAREVVAERNYARRAVKTSDDEVGVLVESFNDMLAEIERRTQEVTEGTLALKQSESLFRQMAENIRDAFFLVDAASNRMLYISPAYEAIWGRSCASLYAHPNSWTEAIHPDDQAATRDQYKQGISAGSFKYECRIVRPDGTLRWMEMRGFPICDASGKIVRVTGVAEDITERKLAAQQLRESERRFRDLLENVTLVSVMLDCEARITYCNEYLLHLTGWRREEVIGQDWFALFIPPENGDLKDRFAALLANRPEEWHQESEIRTCSGEHRLIRWNNSVLQSGGGDVIGTASIGEDITEQKRAELEILSLNASLEQRVAARTADLVKARNDANTANEAKSSFLASMSHEIRTPMNGVIGMVDMLHQTSLKGYQVEMVDLIRESAFSLLTIIDDILDFSKIEAGRLELECAPFPLASIMENACSMLDCVAEKKQVELTVFIDPAIPAQLLGDALRLRQVLINLINNAIKFSSGRERPGKVAVRALLVEPGAQQALVQICVADNGIGMDQETQARLFSAFTQADASTTRRFGGTGLGLVIARHLIELMGGSFMLHSVPDQGSTFTVQIPFARAPAEPGDPEPASSVAGLSCLVVGEAQGLAGSMAAYLTHGGARVECAEDLAQACARMPAEPPGPWVWIIDAPDAAPSLDALRSMARTSCGRWQTARFVLVGRGSCRLPVAAQDDLVLVDGNVLSRGALLKAVSIAAGRQQEEKEMIQSGKQETAFMPPSREQALRRHRLILVAEDNETNQKVILRQLGLLGFAGDIADNGRQALERWRGGDYALLLSDVHMPEMDGYALASHIRAEEQGAGRMPIVALTANALKGEAEHCLAAGMDDYLSKPARLEELRIILEKWLPAPAERAVPDRAVAVDVNVLKQLVGNDAAVVRDFLQSFKLSALEIAQALKAACACGQVVQASAQAHKLKSSARTVGALALGDLCAELEEAGKAGDAGMLAALLARFEQELATVNDFLDSKNG